MPVFGIFYGWTRFPCFSVPKRRRSNQTLPKKCGSGIRFKILAVKLYQFRMTGVTGMSIACWLFNTHLLFTVYGILYCRQCCGDWLVLGEDAAGGPQPDRSRHGIARHPCGEYHTTETGVSWLFAFVTFNQLSSFFKETSFYIPYSNGIGNFLYAGSGTGTQHFGSESLGLDPNPGILLYPDQDSGWWWIWIWSVSGRQQFFYYKIKKNV